MDPSKFVTSWCVRNIWGSYSILVILLGMIASLSAFPTGSVITQTSVPDEDQSLSDSSSRPMIVTHYVGDLQKTLNSICDDYLKKRFNSVEQTPSNNILENLPNISELLPNKVSAELSRRMRIHYQILDLFNRSMESIIFDENQNNESYNFEIRFSEMQKKIETVLAGILETIHSRSWDIENEGDEISSNLKGIFTLQRLERCRNRRDNTVLNFFNQYLSTLQSDLYLL